MRLCALNDLWYSLNLLIKPHFLLQAWQSGGQCIVGSGDLVGWCGEALLRLRVPPSSSIQILLQPVWRPGDFRQLISLSALSSKLCRLDGLPCRVTTTVQWLQLAIQRGLPGGWPAGTSLYVISWNL